MRCVILGVFLAFWGETRVFLGGMRQTPANDRYNDALYAQIPKDSKHIVEIGCSTGALARAWKRAHPDCNYVGVEIDPDYAKAAEKWCDLVLVRDVEGGVPPLRPDVWVLGDVLEHLRDPWAVLQEIRALGGQVVASIPNIQHWSVVGNLACGSFEYVDEGLLDRTHLRWFTKQSLAGLFAGFRIEALMGTIAPIEPPAPVLAAIRTIAVCAGADPEEAVAYCMPVQYVLRAVPI